MKRIPFQKRTKSTPGAAPEFFSKDVATARRFYLHLVPSAKAPLTVVCGGVEHCTKGYKIERRTFPYYCVEYIAQGRGDHPVG
jgi:hypothetical protein